MDIKDFLLARIAEDEAQARAAAPWATGSRHEGQPIDWSIHFDRWSPARVLAECAAKRAIIELHQSYFTKNSVCMTCREFFNDDSEDYPCQTVRALAAVYSDHPDYQPEWSA